MSDENIVIPEESKEIEVKIPEAPAVIIKEKPSIIMAGSDCGTMNIVLARNDTNEIKSTRNVFLPIKEDEISISDLSDINYIQSNDGNLYIIGDTFSWMYPGLNRIIFSRQTK